MKYATLYKMTSSGALQHWTIFVDGCIITKRYGQEGGKQTETPPDAVEGKNIGRANETAPEEQAQLEAKAQWTKKLKGGYSTNPCDAKSGKESSIIKGGIWPMLAQVYSKSKHKIVWPAAVQPKLDGHRCVTMIEDGTATLWSRSRKQIHSMPHIVNAIEELNLPNMTIDGELYNHDYCDKFEELTSLIKSSTPKPGHEKMHYYIYDCVPGNRFDTPFKDRSDYTENSIFVKSISTGAMLPLVCVQTDVLANEEDAMLMNNHWLSKGYEGSMVRNLNAPYRSISASHHCADLQKIKMMVDGEFKVVDVTEGRGKMKGKAVFICETKEGNHFNVKMKGKLDGLKKYFDDPSLAIGRNLTVQYFRFTKKNNVPYLPVGLRFFTEL